MKEKKHCCAVKTLLTIAGAVAVVAGICYAVIKFVKRHDDCCDFFDDEDFDEDFDEEDDEPNGYANDKDFEKE